MSGLSFLNLNFSILTRQIYCIIQSERHRIWFLFAALTNLITLLQEYISAFGSSVDISKNRKDRQLVHMEKEIKAKRCTSRFVGPETGQTYSSNSVDHMSKHTNRQQRTLLSADPLHIYSTKI